MGLFSHPFSTPANTKPSEQKDRAKELAANLEMYHWDHSYLSPIAVLLLHGDSDSSAALDAEPPTEPVSATSLLVGEEHADKIHAAVESGMDEVETMSLLSTHEPEPEPEGIVGKIEGEIEGLFKRSPVAFDKRTGVPKQEVPPFLTYLLPRAHNTSSAERKRKKLISDPPPLSTPADYGAYLAPYGQLDRFNGYAKLKAVWDQDTVFGWQRLAGTNPRVLQQLSAERLAALSEKMVLTDAHVSAIAGEGATVAGEVAAGRLFFCDYKLLEGLPLKPGRIMHPCIGVFWSKVETKELLPVAVQLTQEPGTVHTPADATWPMARLQFQVADFNYHEMGTHLSEAHFTQEAFVVAARRTLPSRHPIGALLYEVYWGLLFNNALGRQLLVNPGGFVDNMMAGQLQEGSLKLVTTFFSEVWSWADWDLPGYLDRQGTTDQATLPCYPYRDDGIPLFKAIQSFADDYVNAWYSDDSAVAADPEIKAWVEELTGAAGLAEKGFPTQIADLATLADVLARLMWQASGGHGGINYSQYQYFAWIPNAPGAAYADEGDLMSALPPASQTAFQQNILDVLTYKIFGRLGQYSKDFLKGLNPGATGAVASFQQRLAGLTRDVAARNAEGPRSSYSYPFLDPGQLPNSTNI